MTFSDPDYCLYFIYLELESIEVFSMLFLVYANIAPFCRGNCLALESFRSFRDSALLDIGAGELLATMSFRVGKTFFVCFRNRFFGL